MFWRDPDYNDGQEVVPREGDLGAVWISGFDFAHNIDKLTQRGIYGVLSAVDLSFKYPENFEQLTFKLDDNQNQKVSHCFEDAFHFIERQRQKTNVLVHCAAGISRCSTILISYLMRKYELGYEEAYKKVKAKRSCVQPNSGFQKQLRAYDKELRLKKAAKE